MEHGSSPSSAARPVGLWGVSTFAILGFPMHCQDLTGSLGTLMWWRCNLHRRGRRRDSGLSGSGLRSGLRVSSQTE